MYTDLHVLDLQAGSHTPGPWSYPRINICISISISINICICICSTYRPESGPTLA